MPTATPTPTQTLRPTQPPAPRFDRWTGQQVIAAFKAAGLEAEGVFLEDQAGKLMPPVAKEVHRFLIPSLGKDEGGRVFVFTSAANLAQMADYYDRVNKSGAFGIVHLYVRDNILVQISPTLAADKAKLYESALRNMK